RRSGSPFGAQYRQLESRCNRPRSIDNCRQMGKEVIRVVAAVVCHEGRYLITQRNANAVLPLLWEFPGGRVEPNEPEATALHREVRGRIGVDVVVGHKLGEHIHEYGSYCVQLTL